MIRKKTIPLIVLLVVLFQHTTRALEINSFFAQSDMFFKAYVSDGLVKYAQIKRDQATLKELIGYITKADIKSMDEKEQLAFYINAYNIWVIRHIVASYPVGSPMDIEGFFDVKQLVVAGESMTLNELENEKILVYGDARVHFVLVCAAMACPRLANFSFAPERLEVQLTQQTTLALNDKQFLRTNNGQVLLSEIFKWYRDDFGQSDTDLVSFINQYRDKALPTQTSLGYYTYDWSLNDAEVR